MIRSAMRRTVLALVLAAAMLAPDVASAGMTAPRQQPVETSMTAPALELAHSKKYSKYSSKRYKRLKPGCRAAYCRPGYKWAKYRKWQRKKYFGRIIAGVALGTIIVTAANAVPRRPSNDLCWYWANSSRTRGYWDYCY